MKTQIYYDLEFLEGSQTERFLGIPYGKTKPTIDLISIGLVEDGFRELYLISKDFNLREAWNRYDMKPDIEEGGYKKVYWIRENVIRPIYLELHEKEYGPAIIGELDYGMMKHLINKYGKTNAQIAFEVVNFAHGYNNMGNWTGSTEEYYQTIIKQTPKIPIELYGYYSAYDHVGLCWLFGVMNDLPDGFPMFTIDLKQMLDGRVEQLKWMYLRDTWNNSRMSVHTIGKEGEPHQEKDRYATFDEKLKRVKELREYPRQTNEHNALADAKWNRELHKFIQSL
jgi:hypothetical protein